METFLEKYKKDTAFAVLSGAYFLLLFFLLVLSGVSASPILSTISVILFDLTIFVLSWMVFIRRMGYNSFDGIEHMIPVLTLDTLVFLFIALNPIKLLMSIRIANSKMLLYVLSISSLILGILISKERKTVLDMYRANKERRERKLMYFIIPILKWQAAVSTALCLFVLFFSTDLFSNVFAIIMSLAVIALGVWVSYMIFTAFGLWPGVIAIVAVILLTVKFFFPFFSGVGNSWSSFISLHIRGILSFFFRIGCTIGYIIWYKMYLFLSV